MKVISPWDMVESKVSNEFSTAKIQLTMKFSRVDSENLLYDYDPNQDQNDVEDFLTGVDKFIGFTEDEKELFAKENTLTFPN